jgi:lipoate-protein ligase A
MYTGPGDADWNMAVDEWLFDTAGARPPVLRLYGWTRPTVSLGRHEPWRKVVDLDRLKEARVDLVRRPTGGRAVLHAFEITYSVTAPVGEAGSWSHRLEGALALISRALVRGLGRLGVPAVFAPRGARPAPGTPTAGLCFETATRYELSVGGAKAVGSAQCRTEKAFLQHGSIPFRPTLGDLWSLGPRSSLRPQEPELPAALLALAHRPLEELSTALAAGFEEELGVAGAWCGKEILNEAAVEALARSKYADDLWTRRH